MNDATSIRMIYYVRFFSYLALSVFLPYYALWIIDAKVLSVTQAAFVVSLAVIMSRISSVIVAHLVKRTQKRTLILICLCLYLVAFGMATAFAYLHISILWLWCVVSILLGFSISTITLSLLSLMAGQLQQDQHTRGFSFINIALNLSAGIGPFLGGLMLYYAQLWLPALSFTLVLLAILLALFLPRDKPDLTAVNRIKDVFSIGSRKFVILLLINFFTFIAYAQFYDIFPLFARDGLGERVIGLLFLVSGIFIVIIQMPFTRIGEKIGRHRMLLLSNLAMLVGVALLAAAKLDSLLLCLLGVLFISVAEVGFVPIYRAMAIQWHATKTPEFALAILAFTWGIAESIAAFVGINLVGHGYGWYSYLIGVVAVAIIIAILLISRVFIEKPAQ